MRRCHFVATVLVQDEDLGRLLLAVADLNPETGRSLQT
jgi:hypothetical protein